MNVIQAILKSYETKEKYYSKDSELPNMIYCENNKLVIVLNDIDLKEIKIDLNDEYLQK
jgi:hypothetical protein